MVDGLKFNFYINPSLTEAQQVNSGLSSIKLSVQKIKLTLVFWLFNFEEEIKNTIMWTGNLSEEIRAKMLSNYLEECRKREQNEMREKKKSPGQFFKAGQKLSKLIIRRVHK